MQQRFADQLDFTMVLANKRAHVAGVGFGVAQLVLFWSYALCFWFGGWLISKGYMDFPSVLKTFFAIIMSGACSNFLSLPLPLFVNFLFLR